MTHIRVQEETKKRTDAALISVRAKNPDVKTYDDLQNYLIEQVNPKPLTSIIKDDIDTLRRHVDLLHPGRNKVGLEDLFASLMIIMVDVTKNDKNLKTVHKDFKKLIEIMEGKE